MEEFRSIKVTVEAHSNKRSEQKNFEWGEDESIHEFFERVHRELEELEEDLETY
jgi:hypothetical protein